MNKTHFHEYPIGYNGTAYYNRLASKIENHMNRAIKLKTDVIILGSRPAKTKFIYILNFNKNLY